MNQTTELRNRLRLLQRQTRVLKRLVLVVLVIDILGGLFAWALSDQVRYLF